MIYDFTTTPMLEIIKALQDDCNDLLKFKVLNPDCSTGRYAGEKVLVGKKEYLHHSIKSWCSLSEILGYRMLTPQTISEHEIVIRYQKLQAKDSFHLCTPDDKREKYGTNSLFAKINKSEEPSFIWYYTQALKAINITKRSSVLNLGINRGDEFLTFLNILPKSSFERIDFVGIDYSESAISVAKSLLPQNNIELICGDINSLSSLVSRKFDLIISVGTLQSPGINSKTLIMSLVQEYMTKNAAMILGFPNARWLDGELIHGAKAPNYPYPEMSLVIKDIYWIKKYLQQHKFRVTITGREYLFLTATKIGINHDASLQA